MRIIWAAKYIRNRIVSFQPGPDRYFTLGLPTGSTPLGCYLKLIEYHKNGDLFFRYVKTFNMDEYVGKLLSLKQKDLKTLGHISIGNDSQFLPG
uniref:Uncharacterized protein n=1 Tax=Eptatretus burgeri TaxID=7764 RepID=A0A8C4Q822_EPTBU